MKYSILIVTHNHEDTIGALVNSLERNGLTDAYFCDAASNDKTIEIIQKTNYKNNLLCKQKLESFSKNNNDLVSYFRLESEYYVILNPDTEIIENVFDDIIKYIDNNPQYLIGVPRLINPDYTIQNSWKSFPGLYTFVKRRVGLLKEETKDNFDNTDLEYALGACLIVSAKLLAHNKIFDERYRLYCEDIDLCFMVHHKGYKIKGFPNLKVIHHYQAKNAKSIFSKHNYWNIQSAIKFILKWNTKYPRTLKSIRKQT